MFDLSGISTHYDYWDLFVREWMAGKYARALHLPEPWWGWCPEDGALHSVTVNLMPGRGGKLQERRCIGCVSGEGSLAYSTMMADGTLREHLRDTEQWHLNRRYRPLMIATGADKECIAKDTRHHLSVELAPFHDTVSNANFAGECLEEAISHTLLFAAEASMVIESPDGPHVLSPLKNIVIVRSSIQNITKIAGEHITAENISMELTGKSTAVSAFRLSKELYPHVSDVLFVCLSGARNNLPAPQKLKQIINIINNKSKQQIKTTMKKFLLCFVAAVLATAARAADGDTFTYEGLKFKVISEADHTVAVGSNSSVSGDISIPSYAVNGSSRYFVTEIGGSAFYNCKSLTSVTIPNSVTEIGNSAFSDCKSLTSVTIPTSVIEIGEKAFAYCSSLTEILVKNGNPCYTAEDGVLFNIDKTTLIQCPAGKTGRYIIPNSVAEIGLYAFASCKSLTSVTIPNSVTEIGQSAFVSCSSLASITIPTSVIEIGEKAFAYCSSLTEILVKNGNPCYTAEDGVLFNVDKTTLIQCPAGKTGRYIIPNSVAEIGSYAFASCKSLTSVTIPNSVAEIGSYAFDSCSSLTSVTIPNSVTEIKWYTFSHCSSLATVTIPASVSKIGESAFKECENLKTIYDLNPTPQTVKADSFSGVPEDAVVYIPTGSFNKYFVAEGWTHFTDFREMGAGVDDILADPAASADVFNLQGEAVLRSASATELENLPAGIYIVRQGANVRKIAVK